MTYSRPLLLKTLSYLPLDIVLQGVFDHAHWLMLITEQSRCRDCQRLRVRTKHIKVLFFPSEYCTVCDRLLPWLHLTDILKSLFNTSAENVFKIHLKPFNTCNTSQSHILCPAVVKHEEQCLPVCDLDPG